MSTNGRLGRGTSGWPSGNTGVKRIKPSGNAAEVAALIPRLQAAGVASVAICLINAFRNGANERAIAEVLSAGAPDIYLSLSSNVAPQIREYPRASPEGFQMDLVEVLEIQNGLIRPHPVYWGWYALNVLKSG